MKWLARPKFIYVSPWLLAAATGLLVLIVVTFAVSNISREKRLMTNAMLQKAATLNRFIRSGAKASYLSDLQRGIWKPDPWQNHVQRIINHLSDDPDLVFIAVINSGGKIFAHSRPVMCGKKFPLHLPADLMERTRRGHYMYTVIPHEEKGRFLEVIRSYIPFQPVLPGIPLSMQELHKRFSVPFGFGGLLGGVNGADEYYMIIALDMKGYDQALGRMRFQVLMLSLAMLLVGIGGWLSLAAVQGYRVSRKALHEIKVFTGLLISKLPVGIIATNTRGTITTWNNAIALLLDRPADQVIGKKPEDVLTAALAGFFTHADKCEKFDEEQGGCEVHLTRDGEEIVLSCHHLT
ncbi:MAG TPA: PAS domain-containing protein, partial [Desulfobulbus sp.]|nr:PAS domain-containing protein [Desulfobulbus sp.]